MDDEPTELIDDRGPSGRHANSIKWPKGDPESSAREKFYRESKDKREIAKVQVLGLLRQGKSVTEAMPEVGRAMKTFYTWTRSDTKFRQRAQAAIDAHNLDMSKARMPYSEQMAEFEPILRKNYPTWTEYVVAFRKAYFNFDTFDHQWQILQAWEKAPAGGISVILIPPEWTKGLAIDTPIPTPSGWTTMGELREGDVIFAGDGTPATVTVVSPVHHRDCYRVTFSDHTSLVCDDEHLWLTRTRKPQHTTSVKSTAEISTSVMAHGRPNHAVPVAGALSLPDADLEIDPYLLGVWLGDGAVGCARISTADPEVLDAFREGGYTVRHLGAYDYGVTGAVKWDREQSFQCQLRRVGVLDDKHIPPVYLRASYDQRLSLLQGLMDSDGNVEVTGRARFANCNERLIDDVEELIRSLGIKVSRSKQPAILNGVDHGPSFRLSMYPSEVAVCRLERKASRLPVGNQGDRDKWRTITACEPVASVPTVCIQVDHPSELFLAGRQMAVTHNTTLLCDTMCADLCDNANTRRALISEASDQARKTMARIQRRFTYDGGVVPPLIDHFGPFQPLSTDRSRKWNSEEFTLLASDHDEQDPSVISVGIQGAIRGARWDAIDLDDVQSVRNLGATAKIMRIFRADVITRPGKQGRIRVTGTRVGREDFYGELERLDLIDEYVTIPALNLSRPKGQQSNFPPQFTPAGAPICADNGEQLGWTDDQLAQRRQKVGEDEWQRVYMQAPQSEHAAMVNDGDILSATDRTRVVGEYVAASVGTIVGLDPALQGHAAFTVCGYNADFMYVTDLVDLFRPTTNQRVFTEIGRLSAKYRPEFWVIENNNIQSGYLVDDAFLAMQEQYGFQAVSHHTGVDKTDRDSQLAVPAMMNAIVRGEIRFPTISENDTAFATLFDQLKSWRPDIPTRRLLQDQVVSLWFCYRLWRNLRESVNQTADSWKRSGLESVTMYPWAQSNIQGPNEQVHERMSMTYAQNWNRLNVSKSA